MDIAIDSLAQVVSSDSIFSYIHIVDTVMMDDSPPWLVASGEGVSGAPRSVLPSLQLIGLILATCALLGHR